MPTVPRYDDPQVQESGLPGVRVQTDAPLEAFGGGQSTSQAAAATQGLADTTERIAGIEKKKADNAVFIAADKQASDLETGLQMQVMQMKGQNAGQAPDFVAKQWDKGTQDILKGLSNEDQRSAVSRSLATRWDSLNKNVQVHVATEAQNYFNDEVQGHLESSRNAAVLNAGDDSRVGLEVARQTAVMQDWANHNGIPKDSDFFKAKLADTLSSTHSSVIQARLDADQPDLAKQYFDQNKSSMSAQDIVRTQKLLENSETLSQAKGIWSQVQGFKLSDGSPDEAKMEATVNSMSGISDDRKQKVLEFVKARAGEQFMNDRRQDAANERSFMNDLVQAKQNGQPLDQAIKLADKYSKDDYDQSVKEAAIKKMYAPPDETDPHTYMDLYDRIQNNTASKKDVDNAFMQGKLKLSDWEGLSKEQSKVQMEGVAPAQKMIWQQIKEEASASISDKKDLATYLTAVQQESRGKTPDEMYKISKDILKKDPKTQTTIPWVNWTFGGQAQYKSDVQKSSANSIAMGTFQQDVGPDVAAKIAQGIQLNDKRITNVEPAHIEAFAQELGGYDKIQPGAPAYNAIQSLIKHNKAVIPASIKTMLNKYPDGKF